MALIEYIFRIGENLVPEPVIAEKKGFFQSIKKFPRSIIRGIYNFFIKKPVNFIKKMIIYSYRRMINFLGSLVNIFIKTPIKFLKGNTLRFLRKINNFIRDIFIILVIKPLIYIKKTTPIALKIIVHFSLFPYYQYRVNTYSNDFRAIYFAKKFIIVQSDEIKSILPGILPETISNSLKGIFEKDLNRMQQLFRYNHIKGYSKEATLKFVMKIAEPIIQDLRVTLEQHLTEELLLIKSTKDNDRSVNLDSLWDKVNKIMIQWESSFQDNEQSYKDTLLHK